jgi:hypothetical protein
MSPDDDPLELEPADQPFKPVDDRRPRLPEPLPVKLVTVDDPRLPAPAGLETQLDDFYVGLLGFERMTDADDALVYRAENFSLHFDVLEPPIDRDTLRALGIEIPSLAVTERQLNDREIPYTRQKHLTPGLESLLLRDPAGNWIELTEARLI